VSVVVEGSLVELCCVRHEKKSYTDNKSEWPNKSEIKFYANLKKSLTRKIIIIAVCEYNGTTCHWTGCLSMAVFCLSESQPTTAAALILSVQSKTWEN